MLTWDESTRRDQSGTIASVSYTAQIPHWGRASIHPHIHHPGGMFLDCPALGIDMHPLGQVLAEDAWEPDPAGSWDMVPGSHGRHRRNRRG